MTTDLIRLESGRKVAKENGYDLEANLALLKLYQFNSGLFNANAVFMMMVRIKFIVAIFFDHPWKKIL